MTGEHAMRQERYLAPCGDDFCSGHWETKLVCSCGHEQTLSSHPHGYSEDFRISRLEHLIAVMAARQSGDLRSTPEASPKSGSGCGGSR